MKSIKTDLNIINEYSMYRGIQTVFSLSERLRLIELYYSIIDIQLDQMINFLISKRGKL
jgi:hypothetical protein